MDLSNITQLNLNAQEDVSTSTRLVDKVVQHVNDAHQRGKVREIIVITRFEEEEDGKPVLFEDIITSAVDSVITLGMLEAGKAIYLAAIEED